MRGSATANHRPVRTNPSTVRTTMRSSLGGPRPVVCRHANPTRLCRVSQFPPHPLPSVGEGDTSPVDRRILRFHIVRPSSISVPSHLPEGDTSPIGGRFLESQYVRQSSIAVPSPRGRGSRLRRAEVASAAQARVRGSATANHQPVRTNPSTVRTTMPPSLDRPRIIQQPDFTLRERNLDSL